MDLIKSGRLLRELRQARGLTQKALADRLGVTAKAVSKWETGKGFPDVTLLGSVAESLGVSEKILLSGSIETNKADAGNMRRLKFFVCKSCNSFVHSVGSCNVSCCSKPLKVLKAQTADALHNVKCEVLDGEYYITFEHPMEKAHYISFVSYVRFDRVVTVKLYPEQQGEVRLPYMRGGKLYMYCSKDGLFELKI